jgi:hypothetical protein
MDTETGTETQSVVLASGVTLTIEQMKKIMLDSTALNFLLTEMEEHGGSDKRRYYDTFNQIPNLDQNTATMLYDLCAKDEQDEQDEQEINTKLRLFEMPDPVDKSPLANLLRVCNFLQMEKATFRLHKYVAGLTSRTDDELERIFPCESPITKQNTLDEFREWLTKNDMEMYSVLSAEIMTESEPEMPEDTTVASRQPSQGTGPETPEDPTVARVTVPVPVPVPVPGQVQSETEFYDSLGVPPDNPIRAINPADTSLRYA